ncbi:MAG: hypothetical protein IPI88_13520, partial [Chitinophagaceae bacterium]|nr:hypothetical protein [Chitinophagaceae bacterium]
KNPNDTTLANAYNIAKGKLDKAIPNFNKIALLVDDFDKLGAKNIAKQATDSGWLKDIEASRLKDDVRNANDFLVLEAKAASDKAANAEFKIAKDVTEKYKEPLKKFLAKEISADSTLVAMNAIYPIKNVNTEKVKKKMAGFSIEKALAKDIDKADNSMIIWGIICTSLLFCLVYLYVEK